MPAADHVPTAAQRTAALRVVLRGRWPDIRFGVRPGRGGSSVIRWTDGPDFAAVEAALTTLERRFVRVVEAATATGQVSQVRGRWAGWEAAQTPAHVTLWRTHSPQLTAAAYLRAAASATGARPAPRRPGHPPVPWWAERPDLADDLDASDVTTEQANAGNLIAALTPLTTERRADWAALLTAGTVRRHAEIVAAVLAEPAARR
jgi:hypothetical protein